MWDKEYPEYIEVPEDYWVCSHDVEYIEKSQK